MIKFQLDQACRAYSQQYLRPLPLPLPTAPRTPICRGVAAYRAAPARWLRSLESPLATADAVVVATAAAAAHATAAAARSAANSAASGAGRAAGDSAEGIPPGSMTPLGGAQARLSRAAAQASAAHKASGDDGTPRMGHSPYTALDHKDWRLRSSAHTHLAHTVAVRGHQPAPTSRVR